MLVPAASLYIHIPYCKSKCDYCDFYSRPIGENELFDSYVERIVADVAGYADKGWFAPLKTVYVGGGTPSLLSVEQIARLASGIAVYAPLAGGCEVTLEANPDDITPSFLHGATDAGITRLSLGIQSLSDASLKTVRRRAGRERCLEALDCVHGDWHRDFSCDMIASLPAETPASFLAGLKSVVTYRPSHISLYALTVSEGTPLYRRVKSGELASPEEPSEIQWLAGRDFLTQEGYNHYEVSNFAKPNAECKHNLAYWRMESYVGAGIGATGSLYNTDGSGFRYTVGGDGKDNIMEELDRDTVIFECLMMGFRTREGVSSRHFAERFGVSLETRIGVQDGVFASWEQRGLAERYGELENERGICYRLTPDGLLFLNRFLRDI
jgi:oxygen-independent coproporphyrinogen-3 oxidase